MCVCVLYASDLEGLTQCISQSGCKNNLDAPTERYIEAVSYVCSGDMKQGLYGRSSRKKYITVITIICITFVERHLFHVESKQQMTDVDSKWATTKCIVTALVAGFLVHLSVARLKKKRECKEHKNIQKFQRRYISLIRRKAPVNRF